MTDILDALARIAIDAGALVLRHYRAGAVACEKSDGSPVTVADRAAEALILAALARLEPGTPVIAEEAVAAGLVPPAGARRFFLVDPLDGTREFVGRNGDFTVNIALVEDGRPTTGIVFAPVCAQIFVGGAGIAFAADVEDGRIGKRRPLRVRRVAADRVVAVASRSHPTPETDAWLRRHGIGTSLCRGSSLKFCLLAAGEADVYPRFGRTMEWDTAAGEAVLRAAGGLVLAADGHPLRYDKRARDGGIDFANPHFVAFGDPALAASCGPAAEAGEDRSR